jgi:ABC-type arginine transport system ATPase subunit
MNEVDAYMEGMKEVLADKFPNRDVVGLIQKDPQVMFLLMERQRQTAKYDAKITARLVEILRELDR